MIWELRGGGGLGIYNMKELFHWWNLVFYLFGVLFFSIGDLKRTLSESMAPRKSCEAGLGGRTHVVVPCIPWGLVFFGLTWDYN